MQFLPMDLCEPVVDDRMLSTGPAIRKKYIRTASPTIFPEPWRREARYQPCICTWTPCGEKEIRRRSREFEALLLWRLST